ncbi:hypothetical protein NC652_030338 [Populus alba x Populus x berolinensis]|nr:hypothetical protein NC652_030338 [Populus alba x Populus x berolinensis]
MSQAQLLQAPTTGLKFTWHNGQQGCNTIQKTLDWVFGNPSLFSAWPATHATVQPRHISDHSAIILNLNNLTHHYHSPFKFLNLWADRSDFLDTVTSSWQVPVNGNPMYRFTTKLRRLKTALKHLHSQYTSSITDRVAKAKADWDTEQVHLDMHPTSEIAKETERSLASQYMQLCKAEESFYKQKSRVQWLQLGDRNTTFFHKSLLHRQVRNRVHNLQDAEGNLVHDQQKIGKIASAYYEELLSTPQPLLTEDITNLFPNSITEESKAAALMPITDEDKPKNNNNKHVNQSSWADRVRVSDSSTRFTLDPLPRQPSIPPSQTYLQNNILIPSTVAPPSPKTTPQSQHRIISTSAIIPSRLPDMETCNSSNASGNECPELEPHHITDINMLTCLESKMDSLRTISESSSANLEVSGATSPAFIPQNFFLTPSPSPTPVRKKKGGKKKKRGIELEEMFIGPAIRMTSALASPNLNCCRFLSRVSSTLGIMANLAAIPRSISDHSGIILRLQQPNQLKHTLFKFLNIWADRSDFLDIVASSWQFPLSGNPMYQLTTKLRRLKTELRKLHYNSTSNLPDRVGQAKSAWDAAQLYLDEHPLLDEAKIAERTLATEYQQLCKAEESYYKQKSRIQWLHLGDRNTAFFHKSLLHRQVRNRIHSLQDESGNTVHDPQELGKLASNYFEHLLSAPQPLLPERVGNFFPKTISESSKASAVAPITSEDIKAALFSIPDTKSPGPDGYNALFFKKSWEIIKEDFIAAIRYFFNNNSLPRCVTATRVALVPKKEHPQCLNDYRPISCCNVIYKCIAKLLVVRLKTALTDVVGPSQTTFIPGRNISDAILLTQELMHNYHHEKGPPRCAIKIDLKKAFDTVRWVYIIAGLHAISLPQQLISWITTCITIVHYTINLNGAMHGFFKATRGIRQGDPLSPYLFVLAMEGLNGILSRSIQESTFHYHWRCQPNTLTHLCFADDLMLFCRADIDSIQVLKSSLDKFSMVSGLNINLDKSSLYLSGVDANRRNTIVRMLGIQEATLPVRYLGVPLISTRLTHTDCIPLMERIIARIKLWTSTSLTYAGRLQLIKSVLFSIQVYWSSIFILPSATIRKIESTLAAFLWRGTSLSHAGAKVAWHAVCYPLNEGGLGIKNLKHWNQAAIIKHIWHLLAHRNSIWVTWIHTILLRGRSF